jgi:hypothetical protein
MLDNIHPGAHVIGEMRCCRVAKTRTVVTRTANLQREPGQRRPRLVPTILPGTWHSKQNFEKNSILYEWATIVGELLRNAPDRKPYHLGGMYIEFENNGGSAVSPPTVARDEGGNYYEDLLMHATRDYLRVPMTAVTLTSTDDELFPFGNRVTSFAQTAGLTGVHGKTFSAAQQSRIYGAALVAFPDFGDATQDLVFSRFYYSDPDNQMVKLVGSEVGIEWRINLL